MYLRFSYMRFSYSLTIALWKKYNLKSVLCRDDKILYILFADMAELADALDLGSSEATRAGSSPVIRREKG